MSDSDRHPVDILADEFASEIRAGKQPSIESYVERYPEHAASIRAIFPSILLVERVSHREEAIARSSSGTSSAAIPLGMPSSLGDFRILREIGRGGMGVVYEAMQVSLKRRVALKVVGSTSSDKRQLERFRREAEAAASLHHTNIVPVFGTGQDQGLQYYAMQLIEGIPLTDVLHYLKQHPTLTSNEATSSSQTHHYFGVADAAAMLFDPSQSSVAVVRLPSSSTKDPEASLTKNDGPHETFDNATEAIAASRVQKAMDFALEVEAEAANRFEGKPLPAAYFRKVAQLCMRVANALHYAHHQGILHRDIKPGNLILDREGTIWITDFGLARRDDAADAMTHTGEIVGTLKYMAPEQIRGEADARTDIYSLGLTLYEMLTLEPAIEQPKARLLHNAVSEIRNPKQFQSHLPKDLQTITMKACAFEPQHRYQSASELEEDLRRFLEDRPILARRANTLERFQRWARRNPVVASLSTAMFALLLLLAGVLSTWNWQMGYAYHKIEDEFNRAESNLKEKTAALESVERERTRAEKNLELAMEAFETVIANIAARSGTFTTASEIQDEDVSVEISETPLSRADITMLENLLVFFEQFARENTKDLSLEAANARRLVGEIEHRLGRLEDATRSLEQALDVYDRLGSQASDAKPIVLLKLQTLSQLLTLCLKRGDMPQSIQYYQEARKTLNDHPEVKASAEGRFALALVLNDIASIGNKINPMGPPRGPLGLRGGFLNLKNDPKNPLQVPRLKREADANQEALRLLTELVKEDTEQVQYQLALAQALKVESRLAMALEEPIRSDESLAKATAIFEYLLGKYPESHRYKYELADALVASGGVRPGDSSRLTKALELCRELIESDSRNPDYRSLEVSILRRLTESQFRSGSKDLALKTLTSACEIQKRLAEQYPEGIQYQVIYVQLLVRLADFYDESRKPELAKKELEKAIAILEQTQTNGRFNNMVQPLRNRIKERQRMFEGGPRNAPPKPLGPANN